LRKPKKQDNFPKHGEAVRFRNWMIFAFILVLLSGLAYGQAPEGKNPIQDPNRIDIVLWDVGGGNIFTPNAKILVEVAGPDAAEIKLFSLNQDGTATDLQTFACQNGSRIYFYIKYNRHQAKALEIRLYDGKGKVLSVSSRNVN
jgi:hypothetical protein